MVIPSRTECLLLMQRLCMPRHIQKHCLMVGEIALYLGQLLNADSVKLNLKLVEAAALLHDIAKDRSIKNGGNHDELGARMLIELGYPLLAPIVKEHAWLDESSLTGPITESLVVNYADKRVKHHQVVSIEERFEDLIDRYAKTPENRVRIREKLDLYRILEQMIFGRLTISPTGREVMRLSLEGVSRSEGENHNDEEETDCCVVVGREIRRA